MKTPSEININIIPQSVPGVPADKDCGGYNVHPAPVAPPGTKKLASKIITDSAYVQTLSAFRNGNTISLAPHMRGIR